MGGTLSPAAAELIALSHARGAALKARRCDDIATLRKKPLSGACQVEDNLVDLPNQSEMAIKPVSERPPERQVRPEHLGVFSARRGGALAGVTGNTIGQWARRGLIEPSIYAGRPANRYAFYDVAEAIVVHWLHKEHFSYEEIRRAIAAAREDYPNWPLVTAPLGIARHALAGDRGLIVQRIGDGYVEVGRAGRQVILRPQLLDFARDMLRTGGWLANELQLARVEVDPQKLGGAPTVRGRRWPVERVARIAADPPGRALLIEDYGLDERDVDESIKWTLAASSL